MGQIIHGHDDDWNSTHTDDGMGYAANAVVPPPGQIRGETPEHMRGIGTPSAEPACDIKAETDALRARAEALADAVEDHSHEDGWAQVCGRFYHEAQCPLCLLRTELERAVWQTRVADLERVNRELTEAAARNDAAHKRVCEELAELRAKAATHAMTPEAHARAIADEVGRKEE